MKHNFLTISGLLLVIIFGLQVYQYVQRTGPDESRLPLVENCSLHLQACSSALPKGGEIIFEINPKQPNSTDTLYLSASFLQFNAESVQVSFGGESINMGYIEFVKYELQRQDTIDESILFSGKGGVAVCHSGLIDWIVRVYVRAGKTVYEVPFKFETAYTVN
jgi:hypothetical protein